MYPTLYRAINNMHYRFDSTQLWLGQFNSIVIGSIRFNRYWVDSIQSVINSRYITTTDIPNFCYRTSTKSSESISIGHQNIIRIFISYFHYQTHDNDTIGNEWVKVSNNNFNEFCITGYDTFRRLCMDGLVNHGSSFPAVYSKPYSPVENFNRFIKRDHTLLPDFKYQALWNNCNHSAITTSCN